MPKIQAASVAEHRAMLWERILDSFGAAVAELGYASVSLADVASRAGIARNSIYNYAPDKQALLLAHVDRSVSSFLVRVEEVGLASMPEAASRMRWLVTAHLDRTARAAAGAEAEALAGSAGSSLSTETGRLVRRRFQPVLDLVHTVVVDGIDAGEFAPVPDPRRTVDLIVGVMAAARSALHDGAAELDLIDSTVDFIQRALAAR